MTMREKIARAIAIRLVGKVSFNGGMVDNLTDLMLRSGDIEHILGVLREPTEAMIEAAAETPGMKAADSAMQMHQARGYGLDQEAFADGSPIEQAWRAMLDAALSEEPTP